MQELEENPSAQELEIPVEKPKRSAVLGIVDAQLRLAQRHSTGILQRHVGILYAATGKRILKHNHYYNALTLHARTQWACVHHAAHAVGIPNVHAHCTSTRRECQGARNSSWVCAAAQVLHPRKMAMRKA